MNKILICGIIVFLIIIIFICIYNFNYNIDDVTKYTYYINLKHRKDRKEETVNELKSFGINNPIRFNAIKDENGAIGCSKSHLEVLKIARKNNYP